jgi:hypothetical protein
MRGPLTPKSVTRAGYGTSVPRLRPTARHDRAPPKSQEVAIDAMTEAGQEISRHRVKAVGTSARGLAGAATGYDDTRVGVRPRPLSAGVTTVRGVDGGASVLRN